MGPAQPTNTVLFKQDKSEIASGYGKNVFYPTDSCGAYYTALWYCRGVPLEQDECYKTDFDCFPCKKTYKDVRASGGFYASMLKDDSGHFLSDRMHYKTSGSGSGGTWS